MSRAAMRLNTIMRDETIRLNTARRCRPRRSALWGWSFRHQAIAESSQGLFGRSQQVAWFAHLALGAELFESL